MSLNSEVAPVTEAPPSAATVTQMVQEIAGIVFDVVTVQAGVEGAEDLDHATFWSTVAHQLAERLVVPVGKQIKAVQREAFYGGFHCQWIARDQRYIFDPEFRPGDPESAYRSWGKWKRSQTP